MALNLQDPTDIYAYHLGTLVGNLHSLEFLLRIALSKGNFKLDLGAASGDQVELNTINEWAYLSALVPRYNTTVNQTHPQYILAKGNEIVQLRNALAHGIVVATAPKPPLSLRKFGKVAGMKDKAVVEYAAEMTESWLQEQRRLVAEAIGKVNAYLKAAGIAQAPP